MDHIPCPDVWAVVHASITILQSLTFACVALLVAKRRKADSERRQFETLMRLFMRKNGGVDVREHMDHMDRERFDRE